MQPNLRAEATAARPPRTHAASPQGFDALRNLVLEKRDRLPKRIAQIATYALDNPDEIAFGTTASIAASAGVQPSTLVRFSRRLGFSGFTSLQSVFRERLRERAPSYDDRLNALNSAASGTNRNLAMLTGFAEAASASLDTMVRVLDEEQLDKAISILAKAETIYLVARGRSYPVACYLAYALGKLNIRNVLIESTAGLELEPGSFATPRDAALAISFSPYTPATIDQARALSERGVPLVGITDSVFSPLAQAAQVWLEIAEAQFGGFRSLAAPMALGMMLAVSVAKRRDGQQ